MNCDSLVLLGLVVEEEVNNLNETVREEMEEGHSAALLEQMEAMLEKIRAVDLVNSNTTAVEELRYSRPFNMLHHSVMCITLR